MLVQGVRVPLYTVSIRPKYSALNLPFSKNKI